MSPAEQLGGLASRAFGLWRIVKLFREVGLRGIPGTRAIVEEQLLRILDSLDPATRAISELNQPGYRDTILADTTEAAVSSAKSAIQKTAIVLAHSILDDVATECCELSATLMPENWMGFIEGRKVTISDVLRTPANQIAHQMLTDYIAQLGKESLLKRIDVLNQKYQPAAPFRYESQPYAFDRDRLIDIDKHRQRIIHQLELSGGDENAVAEDLQYLEATCFYLIFMVAGKHGIKVDPLRDAIESVRLAAQSPVKLAYEGLLLGTSLHDPAETIWSFGGNIFASDANRRVRQLPLLMPAGAPDLSADRQKIVFVRYRQRSPDDPPYSGHLVGRENSPVGDVWISRVDGSDPELVLKGGARPELTPPNPNFPKELEGIQSPKFDPAGDHVYFIADAWVTSGAIYALDLKTRRVDFFTDGNAFIVLHGAPHCGKLLVMKHRYFEPPAVGSYDHYWLVSEAGKSEQDCGEGLDEALIRLYGPEARKIVFPHLG